MQKLHVNYPFNFYSFPARVVAELNNKQVHVEFIDEVTRNSKEYKQVNMTGKFPMLETPEGRLNESIAIAKYLAHGHQHLLGSTPAERAKVDQWCYWGLTDALPNAFPAIRAVHGWAELTKEEYTVSLNAIKASAKVINGALEGDWLVGKHCTVADIVVACFFLITQQTILDGGFRKAMPKFAAWWERVVKMEAFVKVCGHVKAASKPASVRLMRL